MKYLVIALAALFAFSSCAYAKPYISAKAGYVDMAVDDARTGIIKEAALGYQWDKVALEASIGHWRMNIKGTDADMLDYKYIGELAVMPYFATVKFYPIKNFYLGGGIGSAILDMRENYAGDADIDSPRLYNAVAGVEFKATEKSNIFLEARRIFGDLNIESDNPSIGILEDESRLDSTQVMVGLKYTF